MLAQLGGGAIGGIAVGYATKRAVKLALLITGIWILGLYAMMHFGVITVNWEAVGSGLEAGTKSMAVYLGHMVKEISASLVGFTAGFWLGLKIR